MAGTGPQAAVKRVLTDAEMAGESAPTAAPGPSLLDRMSTAARKAGHWMMDTGGEPLAPSGQGGWGKIRADQAAAGIDPNSREANDPMANDWGAQGIVGGIAGGAAGKLIGPLASKLGPLARVAEKATEGAVANRVQGGDVGAGALIGGAMGIPSAVGAGARSARTALRNPQREMGRVIRSLDEAKASGVMETPEFKALPKGAPGFNQAATTAEEQLATHNETLLKDARQQYQKDLADITATHADRHHLVSETAGTIDKLAAENTVNGVVGDEHLAKALDKVGRMIAKDTGVPTAHGANVTVPAVKVGDLLKIKRLVANEADYGNPATPETRPYRILDKTIGRDLEGVDPRVGEMNAKYAATMDQLEKSNEILYGAQSPDINRSISKQKRARGMLGRVGDETQAATLAAKDVEDLKALDPRYKEIVASVEAKKAVERSRFGLPHVSRRIEHLPFAFMQQNATALGAHVIDPALARLSGSPSSVPAGAPMALFRAAEEKRRRDAAMAASLSGGMQQ